MRKRSDKRSRPASAWQPVQSRLTDKQQIKSRPPARHRCWSAQAPSPTTSTARIGGRLFSEGDTIRLEAESSLVVAGTPAIIEERPERELAEIAAWRE